MMRFSTPAPSWLVAQLGGREIEREHGLTMFSVPEREAAGITRALALGNHAVHPGWPRGFAVQTPQGYAIASAHVRRG